MSKPIEPGCKAVIVNSDAGNDGIVVTVGKFAGKINGWDGDDRWYIDKYVSGLLGGKLNAVREHQLKRIDDYDGDEKTTWDSMKDDAGNIIWTPDTVGA
jgi:hypothetical protein